MEHRNALKSIKRLLRLAFASNAKCWSVVRFSLIHCASSTSPLSLAATRMIVSKFFVNLYGIHTATHLIKSSNKCPQTLALDRQIYTEILCTNCVQEIANNILFQVRLFREIHNMLWRRVPESDWWTLICKEITQPKLLIISI